ncbi:phosphoribosylglycinamide formyltransferase [bacterium]|nr:phosphoribosylglycinamide formyltransferase [bacterium]
MKKHPENLAILLSGTGSNFKAISDSIDRGEIPARIVLVASNNPDAKGLHFAKKKGFPTVIFKRDEWDEGKEFSDFILRTFSKYKVEFIALAGYLRKLPPQVVRAYDKRIINIHPALLPDFGGKGMFGMNVHRAVIEAGVSESGVTIHYVDEHYDTGSIIAQERVPVFKGDTPESLAERALKVEHRFYSQTLKKLFEKSNDR